MTVLLLILFSGIAGTVYSVLMLWDIVTITSGRNVYGTLFARYYLQMCSYVFTPKKYKKYALFLLTSLVSVILSLSVIAIIIKL